MELFGINKDGGISLASGSVPTPKQVNDILKACSEMVRIFAINKGLAVVYNQNPPPTNKKPLIERKKDFYQRVLQFERENPGRYPYVIYEQFFSYWTESSKDAMRWEDKKNKYFEIGKRLATFWKRLDNAQQQKFWKQHKDKFPPDQTLF